MVNVKTIEKREKAISDLEKEIINTAYIEYGEAVKQAGSYDKVKPEQVKKIIDKNKASYMKFVKPTTPYTLAFAEKAFGEVLSGVQETFNKIKSPDFLPSYAISLSKAVSNQLNSYKFADVKDPKKFAEDMVKTYGVNLDLNAVTLENLPTLYEQVKSIYQQEVIVREGKKALEAKVKQK